MNLQKDSTDEPWNDGEDARSGRGMTKETVWLTIRQLALLFNRDRTVIGRHIKNIFSEGELDPSLVCAKFAHMGSKGVQPYVRTLYNLDVIISVGYRVHSQEGVLFRIWATSVLKEYLIKGYAVRSNLAQQKYEDLKPSKPDGEVVSGGVSTPGRV